MLNEVRSAPSEGARDVIAVVSEGARARAADEFQSAMDRWRRDQVARMIQDAMAEWKSRGRTTAPYTKVRECVDSPLATPAMVMFILAECGSPEVRNPLGLLIRALGLQKGRPGFDPDKIPMQFPARAARLEEMQAKLVRLRIAAEAARREATPPSEIAQ